jgi:pyruvate formate lyase activating enzyme
MDIKAPFSSYQKLTNSKIDISKIKKSISLIISSGINYEFRTTVMPFFTSDDIIEISKMIKDAEKYYLQNFRNIKTLDENFKSFIPKKKTELKSFLPILKQNIKYVFLR